MRKQGKQVKVLYVCPHAHRASHLSYFAVKESYALFNVGVKVSLCTFTNTFNDDISDSAPHYSVVSN